jgi:proline dehydrogenase
MLPTIAKNSIRLSRITNVKASTIYPSFVRCHSSLSFNGERNDTSSNRTREWRPQIPDFNDSKAAFESKTTPELLRAAASFRLCRIPALVHHAEELLGWSRKVLGNTVTNTILKATLYGHFCAGEDLNRIAPVLKQLNSAGVGSILDYAAESDEESSQRNQSSHQRPRQPVHHLQHSATTARRMEHTAREYSYEDEDKCDRHLHVFQKCIQDAASLSKDAFAAVKVTALGNPKLLSRMSTAIVESKKLFQKFDTNLDGYVTRDEFEVAYKRFFDQGDRSFSDIFDEFDSDRTGMVDYITWSMKLKPADLPKITKSCKENGPLASATPTDEEIELIEAMYARGRTLAETARATGTRLLIDAEQTRFQPAIDNLVLDLQQTYNVVDNSDIPIIYNTYQCYLKDAPERLRTDVNRAKRFNYHFGAKLVRGAYMESERLLAEIAQAPSPIHDTINDTHACYNDSVEFLLEQSVKSEQVIEIMCATHNQLSIEKAIAAMEKCGVDRSTNTICFGQLYGMSDHLSFNLGRSGYRAYKYVPYGEVQEVIPYLLRRARENSSVTGGAAAELEMIKDELKRRLSAFKVPFVRA